MPNGNCMHWRNHGPNQVAFPGELPCASRRIWLAISWDACVIYVESCMCGGIIGCMGYRMLCTYIYIYNAYIHNICAQHMSQHHSLFARWKLSPRSVSPIRFPPLQAHAVWKQDLPLHLGEWNNSRPEKMLGIGKPQPWLIKRGLKTVTGCCDPEKKIKKAMSNHGDNAITPEMCNSWSQVAKKTNMRCVSRL